MDILSISINALVESAPEWHDFEYMNFEEFEAHNGDLTIVFNTASRRATISSAEMATQVTLERIPPQEADLFFNNLKFDCEE